jgi:hypothetical protein
MRALLLPVRALKHTSNQLMRYGKLVEKSKVAHLLGHFNHPAATIKRECTGKRDFKGGGGG